MHQGGRQLVAAGDAGRPAVGQRRPDQRAVTHLPGDRQGLQHRGLARGVAVAHAGLAEAWRTSQRPAPVGPRATWPAGTPRGRGGGRPRRGPQGDVARAPARLGSPGPPRPRPPGEPPRTSGRRPGPGDGRRSRQAHATRRWRWRRSAAARPPPAPRARGRARSAGCDPAGRRWWRRPPSRASSTSASLTLATSATSVRSISRPMRAAVEHVELGVGQRPRGGCGPRR